jgi:hypothetical protein
MTAPAITYQLVCSPKGKETKGSNHRDPFHVFAGMSRTFCGRDAAGWLEIEKRAKEEIVGDFNCCARCAAGLRNRDGGFQ